MKVTYVGADVHQATTTLEMQDANGQTIGKTTVVTDPEMLASLLRALPGKVVLAVEESTHARWLHGTLSPVVHDLIICDPASVRPAHVEDKNDAIDAHWLAVGARTGTLKRNHHDGLSHCELIDVAKGYDLIVREIVATKNRIRALYRSHGLWPKKVYDPECREQLLARVGEPGAITRLSWHYQLLDNLAALHGEASREFVRCAKAHEGWRFVRSVPGFGDIRTAQVLAWVGTPWRFRTDHQLRKYAGLAVTMKTSSDFDHELNRRITVHVRGLNRRFRRPLKAAIKGAAESAAVVNRASYPEIDAYYRRRCQEHSADIALVDVARKLTTIIWFLWKRKEVYDPAKAVWTA